MTQPIGIDLKYSRIYFVDKNVNYVSLSDVDNYFSFSLGCKY